MTTKLAHQTQKTAGIPNGMRTATITAVSGTAVTITVSGGSFSSGVGVLGSYVPTVGDVVAVFRQDSSWLILGPTSAVGRPARVKAAIATTNSATFTTTATTVLEIDGLNMIPGALYSLYAYLRVSSTVSGDTVLGRIKPDSSLGTDIQVNQLYVPTLSASGWFFDLYAEYTATAADTAKTFVVTLERSSGTGSIALRASTTGPGYLICNYLSGG
jgi:hypothetical protein